MKKKILLSTFLLTYIFSFGQCPNTDIILTTQAEIDNFSVNYPNCSVLNYELMIDGENSNITNLNGLLPITNAEDIVIIQTQIDDLYGLDNLVTVSHLAIWFNGSLQSLEGLTSMQTIGSMELFVNNNLINLTGMGSIQSIDNLNLFENSSLDDITQLSFLESMNSLTIGGNALNSLSGLENLVTISGDLSVSNEQINNFNDLQAIQSIGGSLYIISNTQVQDLTAFYSINSLENLYVVDCPGLLDLSGLGNIQTITGKLRIGFNTGLNTMAVFNNITSVGDLDIYENDNLETLKGLENLQEISQRLLISNNPALFSIDAISNVSPDEIDEAVIIVNNNLSLCANPLICAIIDDPSVNKTIQNNAPGCNSVQEVLDSCFILEIGELTLEDQLKVYPNPVSERMTISISDNILFKKATVYSILGERLLETSGMNIDFSVFTEGVYFISVETNKGTVIKKIIKG